MAWFTSTTPFPALQVRAILSAHHHYIRTGPIVQTNTLKQTKGAWWIACKALNLALILTVPSPSHRLPSQLTEPVYNLRKKNHEQATEPIPGGIEEPLVLCYDVNSPELALKILPHRRLNKQHDVHIIWREEDGDDYCLDAGAFTISRRVDDSELDKYFTDLSAPGAANKTESSEALQWAHRLHGASRTFFQLFWLVADGKGAHDHKNRKIPSYGVYIGIEARSMEYMRDIEEKLLGILGAVGWPADVLKIYRKALKEMRRSHKKWEDRGNSDASKDDLWNNPCQEDLSAAIEAIDKRLEETKSWLDTSSNA
ncbi:hypothetical protein FGG08_003126 [Glutinoglossum americanum]|uniref:Uncharacterized protein n=1 Tax=Glutinoglossum americanum TaxID=1670608 RepID=A0A9P8I7T8_9PEZI|nr:hypothetical protein FGG08_003126 [Glutinoglossum americanum]